MRRFFCWFGFHGPRDQGVVGFCPYCGHFLAHATNGRIWTRYAKSPEDRLPPPPPPPVPGVGNIARPAPVEVHVYHHHD